MNTRAMTDRLGDWKERAGDTARDVSETTDRYVHDNAWTSIAIAALVGCVVGFLLGSRED